MWSIDGHDDLIRKGCNQSGRWRQLLGQIRRFKVEWNSSRLFWSFEREETRWPDRFHLPPCLQGLNSTWIKLSIECLQPGTVEQSIILISHHGLSGQQTGFELRIRSHRLWIVWTGLHEQSKGHLWDAIYSEHQEGLVFLSLSPLKMPSLYLRWRMQGRNYSSKGNHLVLCTINFLCKCLSPCRFGLQQSKSSQLKLFLHVDQHPCEKR